MADGHAGGELAGEVMVTTPRLALS